MSTRDRLNEDLKSAMRAKDKPRLETLRLVMAAIKQIEVDERIEVDEARLLQILDKMLKQRRESISQFQSAGRQDLVEKEQFELDLIQGYLPEALSAEAIEAEVAAAMLETAASAMADMGKVMAILKPKLQGRADMSQVSALIKAKLS